MKLSTREKKLIRNMLLAKGMYKTTEIPLDAKVWEPYMSVLLKKINDELIEEDEY
mgnify:CR=1 FL=1|tara:strand:+ start:257 stop:421 length:165 start_codon:yes stop_codon:yes gene_type:complete